MSAHATGRFQFTLRSIFALTTLTAIFFSAYFAGPEWSKLGCLLFAMALLPVSLTVALIYGRGYLRTFCIGGLIPCSMTVIFGSYLLLGEFIGGLDNPFSTWSIYKEANWILLSFVAVPFVVSLATGVLAMAVRSVVEGPRPETQSSTSSSPANTPDERVS
ncbi:MAG: hypothetical protein V3R99_04820 [Thermoguttaceae bacterium]